MTSIRRQLTRELVATLAVLASAGLIGIYVLVRHHLRVSLDDALRARAISIASLTELEDGAISFDFSTEFLADYPAGKARNFFELWDDHGGVVKKSPSLGEAELPPPEKIGEGNMRYSAIVLPNGRPGRAIQMEFAVSDSEPPRSEPPTARRSLDLMVVTDNDELDEILHQLSLAVFACGGLLLAGIFFVVPRVLRRGLQPLEELAQQTERIDAGSLGRRFSTDRLPRELEPVGRRLNDLLQRLEISFERERRFSADLAHELRTPLAELRSMAECALKWPETRPANLDEETLAIARQMEALVDRLLTLTRGDRDGLVAVLKPVDIGALLRGTWTRFESRAAERDLRITLELQPVIAPADEAFLRSILMNLCDNAVDYTSAGGKISLVVDRVDRRGRIRVANVTHDLTAADLPRIFDRFWRRELARTSSPHFGLGLSLSQMFATAMNWSLTAELDATGRVVFSLVSPDSDGE